MEYSINIEYLMKTVSAKRAAEILSKSGFTALDYTPPVSRDNWKDIMRENLDIFHSCGLRVHQTHAPYNRYGKWGSNHKLYAERALEATAEMGAKYMVTHGDEFDYDNLTYTKEAALNYNHDYFADCVKKSAEYGVGMAFENLFCEDNHPSRFCSEADELLSLIKSFNQDNITCCWDFGHANISFKDKQSENMALLADYITCTHVHDNNARSDEHLPPYFGRIDWKACMDVLHRADYKGTVSFEIVHGEIPPEVMPYFTDMLKQAGESISAV